MMNSEKGQVLPLTLIILAVGTLVIASFLGHASSNLIGSRAYEEAIIEQYAADAGVEYAIWHLQKEELEVPEFSLNDKTVNVTIDDQDKPIYNITSTATSDDGSSTTIEAHVKIFGDYSYLLDNAISSPGDVTLQPGTEVHGDVQYNGALDNKGEEIDGEIITDPLDWPTAEEFSMFFWGDVDDLPPLPPGHTIDVSSGTEADPYSIGPLYAEGDLTITGSGVARLDGIIYVEENLHFNPTPGITILLNTQTVYTGGNIDLQPGCTTSGSGCIIAEGDLNYQPNISGDDFVFLMSIEGTVSLSPSNSFYGSIAGNSEVELMPGTSLNWIEPTDGLNYPGGDGGSGGTGREPTIITWQISR